MHAEDIQRLRSSGEDHKFNIKARAAAELLTSIHTTLDKTEQDIDDLLNAGYSEKQNTKLMIYLTTLRGVEDVVNKLKSI